MSERLHEDCIDEIESLGRQLGEAQTEIELLDNGNAVWLRVNERLIHERDEAQARLRKANCDYGDGWLNDDLECQIDVEPWCGKHAVLYYIKTNKEAAAREVGYREALQKYGTHTPACLSTSWKRGENEYRCNCGLDAALDAALAPAQGKE